jgi:hypothetical protein
MTSPQFGSRCGPARQSLHHIGAHIANLLWRERGAERRHVAALRGYGLNRGREIYWRFLIVDDGFVADIVALITSRRPCPRTLAGLPQLTSSAMRATAASRHLDASSSGPHIEITEVVDGWLAPDHRYFEVQDGQRRGGEHR